MIDKLRIEYGLTDIFDTQYQSIYHKRRKFVLAVAGAVNSGKSSFINYLLESSVCPVGVYETTARLTKITYGPQKLIKLISSTGELTNQYEIDTDEKLRDATQNLIALQGTARNEESCKDIVIIELDRKELENIELWDIPGYDENEYLNTIIEDILNDTDLFFISISITEGVRKTIIDLLQSCFEKHKRQPQVCFIVTKIDEITRNLKANTSLENTLDHVFHRVQDSLSMKLGTDWTSSPFFIPLCTDPEYSLKDFLLSHEQFTRKLTQFCTTTERFNRRCRLEDLIDTIHELFDYDNLDRSIQRDERLTNMLDVHQIDFKTALKIELKEVFIEIHQVVANKIFSNIQPGNDEAVKKMLVYEINEQLKMNHTKIERSISECLDKFYSNLEKNPALKAVIWSYGRRNLYGDPYRTIIGQYQTQVDNLISSEKFYHNQHSLNLADKYYSLRNLPNSSHLNKIKAAVSVLFHSTRIFTNIKEFIVQKSEWKTLNTQFHTDFKSSVEIILDGIAEDISNHIHEILSKQLNTIQENIKRRKLMKASNNVQKIVQFLRMNIDLIVQLYFNLLDQMNRLEYPHCEINDQSILNHNNFPVFAGKLGDADGIEQEEIAAKRVPARNLTWQELRYMNELKHENILRYYGVRKNEAYYDILIQKIDFSLITYIDNLSREEITDKLVDDIFVPITHGLAYLHEQGFIHRDIKPENILVQIRGGEEQSPIFILAGFTLVDPVPLSIQGTQDFLAPELCVNSMENTFITEKVDIFAFGTTIQQILEKLSVIQPGKYVEFWLEMSQRCRLNNPFQRPACQKILQRHKNIIQ